jgi:predicted Zn-dependent protease
MISSTDYAILVLGSSISGQLTENNSFNRQRDGLFEIRDGKIAKSVKNFRFNKADQVLSNILDIGKAENAQG